ncbi:MAG: PAS domain S-box protein, partial [Chloroflexota bacterium]
MKTNRKTTRTAGGTKAGKKNPRAEFKGKSAPMPRKRAASTSGVRRFETILGRVNDGIVAFDARMNYTYVNARGGELLGRKPEDLVGKNYWAEYPEAKETPFANAYVRALETQKTVVIEDYYAPWDRWFENRIYPSKDGFSVFFTEITERKKAEQTLREAQERLTLAIRSANIGLWDWDLQANKVRYSPEWKSQLGYEDREISDDFSEWESRVHPEDLERAKATIGSYIEKPYSNFHNEFRMRRKDGSYRWILAQASLYMDEHGKPIRMIGSHIDITGRKQAEETLRISEEYLSAIYNHTNVGIFVVRVLDDGEFMYEGINPTHEKLLGLANSQVAGRSPDDLVKFFGAESMNYVKALYSECAQKRKPIESEFFVPEGAAQGWWFSRLTPLVDAKTNDVVRLIGTSILITERKQAEETLQRNEQVLRLFV